MYVGSFTAHPDWPGTFGAVISLCPNVTHFHPQMLDAARVHDCAPFLMAQLSAEITPQFVAWMDAPAGSSLFFLWQTSSPKNSAA